MKRGGELSTAGIVWRIGLSVFVTMVIVGTAGYFFARHHLNDIQVDSYALLQQNDVDSLVRASRRGEGGQITDLEVQEVLRSVTDRATVTAAEVVGPGGVVRGPAALSGNDARSDPDVIAATEGGRSTAELTEDPATGQDIFKFVSPVDIGGRRLALYTTYDNSISQSQMADLRLALILTILGSFLLGFLVFYFVGGRWLLRDHRYALQRASLDGLTGLSNQRSFAADLGRAAAASERVGDLLSLVFVDIDEFKTTNDEVGRKAGDEQLTLIARLLERQGLSDVPYRIGGDEFALLMPDANSDAAIEAASAISSELREEGIRTSIGVSTGRPGIKGEVVHAEALEAMREARRRGGSGVLHFDELRGVVRVASPDKLEAVRRLISEEGLTTAFQPIWDFSTMRVMAYEALTRPDPRYGLDGPAEAFDIAEQMGQVHKLDEICVRNAFLTSGGISPDQLLFVNLTPQTLDIDATREIWVQEAARVANRAPDQIVIEVTERFGGRSVRVMQRLQTLKNQGFGIAIDDVGTGNSGLEMLGKINAEFIKIDRSIVADAPVDPSARALITAMALFAERTGTFVIAEGIEDAEMLQYVQSLAEPEMGVPTVVNGGQGFGLGRPSVEVDPDPVWPLD